MTPLHAAIIRKEGLKMKKSVALMLAAMLLISSAAFAETLAGGWAVAEKTEITEDLQAVFDKAMEKLMGVSYEPVAYLGSQVVAGLNHCFLCKATVIYPNAAPAYKLVYIYQDLEGNAEILNIADLDIAQLSIAPVQE